MELRQLKYFLAVAEEGQITKAAKRLHVTQPPLSQQMILLEKELGVQLIERNKKQLRLTEAGHILRRRAAQMLELLTTTRNELEEATDGISGRLAIGTITSAGRSVLPEKIQKFHQLYPKVSFHLRQGETSAILELLDTGLIEIGIVRFPVDQEIYECIPLPNEAMMVAATNFPITGHKVRLAQLNNYPLLLHHRHKAMIVEHCRQVGFEPLILCTSDDITPLLLLANLGIGAAIIPQSGRALLSDSSLVFHELVAPVLKTTSAVIWKKSHPLSSAATHFIAMFSPPTSSHPLKQTK